MVAYELPSTVFALVVLFAIDFFAILLYTGTVAGGTGQFYLYIHNLKYNICPDCHFLLFRFSILFETPPGIFHQSISSWILPTLDVNLV